MLYNKLLKKIKKCPFDSFDKEEIIKENRFAVVILARSPYTKNHLLVIPKKHKIAIKELTLLEKKNLWKLINWSLKKLYTKHKSVSIIYREGKMKEVGKSISHMHVHLIPHIQIGAYNIDGRKRKVMGEDAYRKKTRDFLNTF